MAYGGETVEQTGEWTAEADGSGPGRAFLRGAAGSLGIVAAFLAGGLGWALLQGAAYPGAAMADEREAARVWLVDGFNLLHAAMLSGDDHGGNAHGQDAGWWRAPARARVLELAAGLGEPGAEVWVVFDGVADAAAATPPGVHQVFAPSADEWLVHRVKSIPRGTPVTVVTADRRLANRARHHGAQVVSPHDFAARCSADRAPTPAG